MPTFIVWTFIYFLWSPKIFLTKNYAYFFLLKCIKFNA